MGRRAYDGFCPLHDTHHNDIQTLKTDLKGKIGMKLFLGLLSCATALFIFVGGVMIKGQAKVEDSIVEIKTTQARIETKVDIYIDKKPADYDSTRGLEYPGRDP